MFKITHSQHDALQEVFDRRKVVPEICQYLRQAWPEAVAQFSEAALLDKVARACSIARRFHLQSGSDIYSFVTLEVTTCPGFYEREDVASLLKSAGTHGDMRMLELFARLPLRSWSHIMRT